MSSSKVDIYDKVLASIANQLDQEPDTITRMSTIACELFHAFEPWNWVGFYRRVDNDTLKVGPYQGTHGCLETSLDRGVCGKCAREKTIQLENAVKDLKHHIPCSSSSESEIVLPIIDDNGYVQAVLDIDCTEKGYFDQIDVRYLRKIITFA